MEVLNLNNDKKNKPQLNWWKKFLNIVLCLTKLAKIIKEIATIIY